MHKKQFALTTTPVNSDKSFKEHAKCVIRKERVKFSKIIQELSENIAMMELFKHILKHFFNILKTIFKNIFSAVLTHNFLYIQKFSFIKTGYAHI